MPSFFFSFSCAQHPFFFFLSLSNMSIYSGSIKSHQTEQQNRLRYTQSITNKSTFLEPSISNIGVLPPSQQTRGPQASLNKETRRPTTSHSLRPNTAASTKRPPKIIMSITEGRGVAVEVGLCIFDANSCEVILSQVRWTPLYQIKVY